MSIDIIDERDKPRRFEHLTDAFRYIQKIGGKFKPEDEDRVRFWKVEYIDHSSYYETPEGFEWYKLFTTIPAMPLAFRNSDFLTVLGTAECVKDDVAKWGIHGDVAVVNDMGFYAKRFNHLVSVHAQIFPLIKAYRENFRSYEKFGYQTHTAFHGDVGLPEDSQRTADYHWRFRPIFRSSGLLAVWIGIILGYKGILTLGVPLAHTNHFYDITGESHVIKNYENFLVRIKGAVDLIVLKNVRAASGPFSEFVGEPTKEWIDKILGD